MRTTMNMGEPPKEKHGGMVRRGRHARGGKATKVNEYNAQGSPEANEAADEDETFKRGGAAKKHGGRAEGEKARERADKMPRGKRKSGGHVGGTHRKHEEKVEHHGDHGVHHHGAHGHAVHHHGEGDIRMRRGGEVEKRARGGRTSGHSPFSSGRMLTDPSGDNGPSAGHEGQKVPAEPE